jgi:uncharacterized protein (DUF1501 family)
MLDVFSTPGDHSTSRRKLLRVGALGLSGLMLSDLFRLRAQAATTGRATKQTSVIQVFLSGGPSHLETFDPKPDAPADFRGELNPIATALPGVSISELLPRLAKAMDKLAIVRSLQHTTSDHSGGTHWVMTGYAPLDPTPRVNERPSIGSVAARSFGSRVVGMPPYVAVPSTPPFGRGAYLGPGFDPFARPAEPANGAKSRDLDPPEGLSLERLDDRRHLLTALDRIERHRDASGTMEGMDRFTAEAYAMVAGSTARRAFDLTQEDPRVRDRYGRTPIGQGCLLARRLVEAGVAFVTVTDSGWDHHNQVFSNCRRKLPPLDAAIASLVGDLHERGLAHRVLVLVWGEFGRTPRVNGSAGRDHWPGCMSALVSGGGLAAGQVVGASNSRGEHAIERPLRPEDLIRTVYDVLGIDPYREFLNEAGRPMAVLSQGRPIAELWR